MSYKHIIQIIAYDCSVCINYLCVLCTISYLLCDITEYKQYFCFVEI